MHHPPHLIPNASFYEIIFCFTDLFFFIAAFISAGGIIIYLTIKTLVISAAKP